MTHANPRARHHVLGIVALALFAALFTRLWYLQVLTTEEFEVQAQDNRTQEVIIEAPRGRILDRNAEPLVENRRTIQVSIDFQDFIDLEMPEQSELLRRLADRLSEDQWLQYGGDVEPNDPGAQPFDGDDPETAPDGSTPDAPTTEDEGAPSEDDPAAPGEDPEDDPTRRPPAGVATGAENPDGQTEVADPTPEPVTEESLRRQLNDDRVSKFKPVPVANDISEALEISLRERPEEFPTVTVERVTVRAYNYGALLAHVLGYVGSVTDEDLAEFQNGEKPYENDDDVGKSGIERGMERELRGTPGQIVYEVDARNRPIKKLSETPAKPGRDVYLTVDINLQYLMERGLATTIEDRKGKSDTGCFVKACDPPGAASVALDPRNGQVLAMASYPTYDPNLFVGGIPTRDYEAIASEERKDIHHNPLLNRAIGGTYAVGSTFKLFSAHAGLATGEITPGYVYNDTGRYEFSPGNKKCNAGCSGLGAVNLTEALTKSSDTYFYKLGDEAWLRRDVIGETAMQDQMMTWGLGERTGIDLPGEEPGRIPTPEWLREFSNDINADDPALAEEAGTWRGGTSADTMVGQGSVLVTPLQLANGYAALANGGTLYRPELVLQVTELASGANPEVPQPEATGQVELPPEWRDPMMAGFDGVTKRGTGGTASGVFSGFDQSGCSISGKTGTAQALNKNDSSLFTSFAPSQGATIATATVFEQAGFGGKAAAPFTRKLLEPFAAAGCTIEPFGKGTSAFPEAPKGGWFDAEAAAEEFLPPATDRQD
ncbi:hypothetical protein BH24ACT4_BH24ACT4_04420 [soil metagenome]